MSQFFDEAARLLFGIGGIVALLGAIAALAIWSVDRWAVAVGLRRELVAFIFVRGRRGLKLPRPSGLPYALDLIRGWARKPCTAEAQDCAPEGYGACNSCAARYALAEMGLPEVGEP